MNKKGFAISVVLYTMLILIIGIFYLLLGIVRNRYMVGNDLKQMVINSMSPDKIKPVCNFISGPSQSSIDVSSTATYVLECTDNTGKFSDSDVVSSDFTLTSSGVVSVQNPVVESIDNGFRYTITVTGSVAGATSLNLIEGAVVDDEGNGNNTVVSNIITVNSISNSDEEYTPACGFFSGFNSGTYDAPFEIYVTCDTTGDFKLYKDGNLISSSSGLSFNKTLTESGTYEFYMNDYDSSGTPHDYQTRTYTIN